MSPHTGCKIGKMDTRLKENSRRKGFWFPPTSTIYFSAVRGYMRDSKEKKKHDSFPGKKNVLKLNLLGLGLTQEFSGDRGFY